MSLYQKSCVFINLFICLFLCRHEGFDVNNPSIYTRSWFAWANTVFGDFVLYLDREYPHLLQGQGPRALRRG